MRRKCSDENGYGLLEVLVSMAILSMAAVVFTGGMLGALRLQMDARQKRASLAALERAAIEEEEPQKHKELNLTIAFDGIRLDTKAELEIYESKDEKVSLGVLYPKAGGRESVYDDEE